MSRTISWPATIDPGLVRTLVRAFAIRDQLFRDDSLSLNDIAERENIVPSYATRLFRLAFLSPDIIDAILGGRHPPELTARKLLDDTRLPLDWSEQETKPRLPVVEATAARASLVCASDSLATILPPMPETPAPPRSPVRDSWADRVRKSAAKRLCPTARMPAVSQASEMSVELRSRLI